jgi:hypothetical protein
MTRWEYRTPGTALWWSDVAGWCADALYLLKHGPPGLARPPRGARAHAPQTPRIVALANRAARLARDADALPTGGNWIAVHGDAEKPHGVRKP